MSPFLEIRKNKYLYLLALPGFLFLIIFAYIPISAHILAFKEYSFAKGFWGSPWVGLKNFEFFFGGADWLQVTFNTVRLNFLFIIFGQGAGVLFAIFINEIRSKMLKKVTQSAILLPYFLSWMVVAMMAYVILNSTNGVVNSLLKSLGSSPINWYQNPEYWLFILPIAYVWKTAGFCTVIYLAAITGISSEIYESATIDGASKMKQMIYITLPLLRPTVIVMTLMAVGRIFYGDFGMIYGLVGDNGMLFATTDVIDTYSYRALRQLGNFSMSSAVVLYQSVMGVIAVCIFNWFARKIEPDSRLY